MSELAALREKVAAAREILLEEGLISRYGHLSAFAPDERLVLITPNAPSVRGRMAPQDILTMDLDGRVLEGQGGAPLEWIIHTAIHRARPDALAVIHTHPLYSTSLTIAGQPIRAVYQHGAILGPEPLPVYDDPVVITTPAQAAELVAVLGSARAVELRGHGSVTVGRSVEEAFATSMWLEDNCKKQLFASLAGSPRFLSADEIRRASRSVGEQSIQGFWDYYYHRRR